jgi:hypothetical protein
VKKAFLIVVLLFLCGPVIGKEVYLRDVPEGHWAYDAVYDLIRQGVTGGYPDGTYRGKKMMTRFETASFLSKLARSFKLKQGINEKLIEELRAEAYLYQARLEEEKKATQISGDLQYRFRVGRMDGPRDGRIEYRLRYALLRNFSAASSLKLSLDTMDGGYNGAERDLALEMLDVEGKIKFGPSQLKLTFGPGDVPHPADSLFPAEKKLFYLRPYRSLALTTDLGRTSFGVEYLSRSTQSSGYAQTSEVSAILSQKFSGQKLSLNPRLFYNSDNQRDLRIELGGELNLGKNFIADLLLGADKGPEYPHGLYLKGALLIAENIRILAQRIGTQYRSKFNFNIYDLFDRNVEDGSTSIGLEVKNILTEVWLLGLKGDYNSSGPAYTGEIRVGRRFGEAVLWSLVYQGYNLNGSFYPALGMEFNVKI